jgi:deoxycytidylate deaminase
MIPTDKLIKTLIERLPNLEVHAQQYQLCKRKACGSQAVSLCEPGLLDWDPPQINGPLQGHECSGEVGNCGCMHSEPKVLLRLAAKQRLREPTILLVNYSSCQQCVNMIVHSELVDVVIYDHFAPHWMAANELLKQHLPVWSREELINGTADAAFEEWHFSARTP